MIGRYAFSIAIGSVITLALLFVMHLLIEYGESAVTKERARHQLDFLRVRRDESLNVEDFTPEKPPKGLTKNAAAFWRSVNDKFVLEDHHRELLSQAAFCLARIDEAKEAIARDGVLVKDRWQQWKENPACAIEIANKRAFKAIYRELGLDIAAPNEGYDRVQRLSEFGRSKRSATA